MDVFLLLWLDIPVTAVTSTMSNNLWCSSYCWSLEIIKQRNVTCNDVKLISTLCSTYKVIFTSVIRKHHDHDASYPRGRYDVIVRLR